MTFRAMVEANLKNGFIINQRHVISITEHLIFAHHSVKQYIFVISTHQAVIKRTHQHSLLIAMHSTILALSTISYTLTIVLKENKSHMKVIPKIIHMMS
jgi:hypothetical protein